MKNQQLWPFDQENQFVADSLPKAQFLEHPIFQVLVRENPYGYLECNKRVNVH